MRQLILVVCAGVTLSGQAVRPPSELDMPMTGTVLVEDLSGRNPCHLWTALEQLVRQARVRIGFEHTLDCRPAPWALKPYGGSLDLSGLTPRQAIDRVLAQRPDDRWVEVDDVAVVRPVTAWAPEGSVLNAPVSPFAVADEHPHHVLHTLFRSSQPSLFQEHTDVLLSSNVRRHLDQQSTSSIDTPMSLRFAGGNVAQALNAITRGFRGGWQVAYDTRGDNRQSLWVSLHTLDADAGVTMLSSSTFATVTPAPR